MRYSARVLPFNGELYCGRFLRGLRIWARANDDDTPDLAIEGVLICVFDLNLATLIVVLEQLSLLLSQLSLLVAFPEVDSEVNRATWLSLTPFCQLYY